MKFCKLFFALVLIFLSISVKISFQTRKVISWQNLESFLEDGWLPRQDSTAFTKPSDLDPTLAPLDEEVTGGGVWSGSPTGYPLFPSRKNISSFPQILEANLTLKYYHSANNGISFQPCINPNNSNQCFFDGDLNYKWHTVTYAINLTSTEDYVTLNIITRTAHLPGLYLLDEVVFSYEVLDDPCNESCVYQGIDCHNYYSCIDYSYKRYFTCEEEDGLAFNPEVGMCDRMENVEGCHSHPKCEYRPDPRNCSNYYFCPNVLREDLCELRTCPGKLLYSVDVEKKVQQCTLPSKAKCA